MAYLKNNDKFRFYLDPSESPTTFPSLQRQGNNASANSPMTDLALNLSDAKLANSPAIQLAPRRLSLSSDCSPAPSPVSTFMQSDGSERMAMDGENRLLKNAIKFPGIGSGKSRSFARRISLVASDGAGIAIDKENCDVDMSLLSSPKPSTLSPMKAAVKQPMSPLRLRQPLEDQDPNSQDSGYSDKPDSKGYRFAEPFGPAPRKHVCESLLKENATLSRNKSEKLFQCLSSGTSSEFLDDGFLEFDDRLSEDSNMPNGLNCLLNKPIFTDDDEVVHFNTTNVTTVEECRRTYRRSQSLIENVTPNCSRVRSCLFKTTTQGSPMKQDDEASRVDISARRSFKRPDPPCNYVSPSKMKRRKASGVFSLSQGTTTSEMKITRVNFQRCHSETEATIKTALHRSHQDPHLIGDFSKPYILPLIEGRHQDLKTISPHTLANLMNGHYSDSVETFTVVDCRYPYEFDGGHIRGAKNIFTKDQVLKDLVNGIQPEANSESVSVKRKHIMVFHCEFSSERGPSLYRFLRSSDRTKNEAFYPALDYPELYLLEGGYKQFFEQYRSMCEPEDYRPMLHPNHDGDLRLFRAKTKSWSGDCKGRYMSRNSFKRLGNE